MIKLNAYQKAQRMISMNVYEFDDESREEFEMHLERLWDLYMDYKEVSWEEASKFLPKHGGWDKDVRVQGMTVKGMAVFFFDQYAYELFDAVKQERIDNEDLDATNRQLVRGLY